jgi:hypothetical protein
MKRFRYLLLLVLSTLSLAGCGPEDIVEVYPADLHGLWVRNQEYWRFKDDNTGVTWDESEDITEEESNLKFEWTLSRDELTCVFRGAQGNQAVPKLYVIRSISSTQMTWEDYYGIEYTFRKVQ